MIKILNVELDKFNKKNDGPIVGTIYFTFEGAIPFPSKSWVDMTGNILSHWESELSDFLIGNKDEALLFFMDGDFMVLVGEGSKGKHSYHLWQDYYSNCKLVGEGEFDANILLKQIRDISQDIKLLQ